jgi:hypothetical protein
MPPQFDWIFLFIGMMNGGLISRWRLRILACWYRASSPRVARRLTNRSSGRVRDKVPSSYTGVRAAQLSR